MDHDHQGATPHELPQLPDWPRSSSLPNLPNLPCSPCKVADRKAAGRGLAGGNHWGGYLVLAAAWAVLALAGCSYHYIQGQALQAEGRWEEAAIEYRLAYVQDPDDADYREALERANIRVARENFDRYQEYIASKEFAKAYQRLNAAAQQDPNFLAVREEMAKWVRVLVCGQVKLAFESFRMSLRLADEINIFVSINSPNPGEVIDTEINLDTGVFFAEHLLYDPPDQLLARYTLRAFGVALVRRRGGSRQFTSTDTVRLVNFRTPVLETFEGDLALRNRGNEPPLPILAHRRELEGQPHDTDLPAATWFPSLNLRYSLEREGDRVIVTSQGGRTDFVPRFLYLNLAERRMLVEFGHYELRQDPATGNWGVARLPLNEGDYFLDLSRNIVLQPYFFYHNPVLAFEERSGG